MCRSSCSSRPLPAGKLSAHEALAFGLLLAGSGVLYLFLFTNALSAALSALTLLVYLGVYTPLKRVTPFAVLIGGIPGALPPLIGWTAVEGDVTIGGWSLFFILFFWQMPHFLSLAWIYRRDYEAAGYRTMAVADPSGGLLVRQSLVYTLALFAASLMPTLTGIAGVWYFAGACALSAGFFLVVVRFGAERSQRAARRMFFASLIYLTAVILLMMLDRAV